MSVAAPPTPPATAEPRSITVISHSTLFYWWPVWAVGFILGILTYLDHHRMVVVPANAKTLGNAKGTGFSTTGEVPFENQDVVVLPAGTLPRVDPEDPKSWPAPPKLHTTNNAKYGVLFATVLVLVTVITNVPLRGMWSVVIIIMIILMSVIFALADWWGTILQHLALLDIRINAGGYFFISSILLGIWVITTYLFDRQLYMVVEPGQLKVCSEIGGGQQVYDATGLSFEKKRSDLFRHWILGLGSGDLIVRTSGAQAHQWEWDNVLFIGKKVAQIEDLLKKKAVVPAR
jgi:hypothetical protein